METASRKELNFEINLLPVISLLAVVICFLLLTTIWIHIGTMNVDQAFGGESVAGQQNPPSIWLELNSKGEVTVSVKDVGRAPKSLRHKSIAGDRRGIDWEQLTAHIDRIQKKFPQIQTALILPSSGTAYEDIITTMDELKKRNVPEVGISPL